jgi:chromosome partitioning protein
MAVIAVANQKGGVGKTTTVVNLGAALQEQGHRVLLIDNDPQANLAVALGLGDPEVLGLTLGDLLTEGARGKPRFTADEAVVATPAGLDLLPANTRLSAAELVLVGAIGREMVMRDLLAPLLASYDHVIVDCLPSLGLLTINALTAADAVLIPVQADYLALQGLVQILETIGAVRARLNPSLETLGALLTMMDVRTSHARGVAALLREALADQVRVFDAQIRTQVALKDSAQEGRPILVHRSDSQAAEAYRALAREVVDALAAGRFQRGREQVVSMEPVAQADPTPARPGVLAQFGRFIEGRESWLGQERTGA